MRANGDEDSIASFRKRLHFVGADGALEMDIDVAHAENGPDVFVQTLARKTVGRNAVAHHAAQALLFFI